MPRRRENSAMPSIWSRRDRARSRSPETSARRGDNQVTFEHDSQGKPHRITVRRSDHRLPVDRPRQQIGGIGAPALRAAMMLEFLALPELALMNVGAAGKRAATSADDRYLRLRVEVKTPQRMRQMPHQIVAKGVQPVR